MTEIITAAEYRAMIQGMTREQFLAHIEAKRKKVARKAANKKKPQQKEAKEQGRVVAWARERAAEAPDFWPDLDSIFCSLAGVKLSKAQAGKAKAQGNRAGVFDLVLLVPRNGFHGLLVEMKADNGRPSEDQLLEHKRLVRLGYSAHFCYGFEEAIQTIKNYYGRP